MENWPIADYYEFCYERQHIWHKKSVQKLPPPWTNDTTLQTYHFCNVYREIDKGTKYIIDRVINNNKLSNEQKILNIVAYRFFNKIGTFEDTFEGLLDPKTYDFKYYERLLDSKIKSGQKLFHVAYIITPKPFHSSYRTNNKHIQVLLVLGWLKDQLVKNNFLENLQNTKTAEDSFRALDIPLTGNFLRYEIWQDISYTNIIPFTDNDFLIVGPGALWGIELIESRPIQIAEALKYCFNLRDSQEKQFQELKSRTSKDWLAIHYKDAYSNVPHLSLANIEAGLCEFRKYIRLNDSTAQARKRIYKAPSQPDQATLF
jgi:alpha-glutamyl/putrescinyl thymine pyrophosphorylase clade 1